MSEDIRKGPSGPPVEVASGDATVPLTTAPIVDPGTLVPFAEQTGFIGLPFGSAQQGVDACPVDGVVLVAPGIAGFISVDHALKVQALGGTPASVILDDIVTSATLSLQGVTAGTLTAGAAVSVADSQLTAIDGPGVVVQLKSGAVVGVCSAGILFADEATVLSSLDVAISAVCDECVLTVPMQGGQFTLTRCAAGDVDGSNLIASDSTTGVLTLTGLLQATRVVVSGPATVGGTTLLESSTVLGLLTATAGGSAVDSNLQGGLTAGASFSLLRCRLGGNVAVTGTLTIDRASYNAALKAGFTVAATVAIVFSDVGSAVSVIGYTAAAPLTITVLPAGHVPGLYLVTFDWLVRVAGLGSGTATKTLSYTAPTIGAVSMLPASASGAFNVLGRVVSGSQFYPATAVRSSGVGAIQITMTPVGAPGTPQIDIYAAASLQAAA